MSSKGSEETERRSDEEYVRQVGDTHAKLQVTSCARRHCPTPDLPGISMVRCTRRRRPFAFSRLPYKARALLAPSVSIPSRLTRSRPVLALAGEQWDTLRVSCVSHQIVAQCISRFCTCCSTRSPSYSLRRSSTAAGSPGDGGKGCHPVQKAGPSWAPRWTCSISQYVRGDALSSGRSSTAQVGGP
jgi:hypothetical protein